MRIVVDLNRCQGYGQCVFASPSNFWMEGEEALYYNYNASDSDREDIVRAAAACPMQAILIDHSDLEREGYPADVNLRTLPR